MSDAINREVYDRLTVDEKIQLVHDIWDDIARMPKDAPLTPDQSAELERRLKAYDEDPSAVVEWVDLRRALRGEV